MEILKKAILTPVFTLLACLQPALVVAAIHNGIPIAKDINSDPNIVEINLEASVSEVELTPGVRTKMYTYNGSFPGPLIKAKVGDTLIVNFKNSLPESSSIHWHGLRLPALMDGSTVSQNPVPPGGTFTYKFKLKDASLFWYHPHVRTNEQVEKGLAGPLWVTESDRKLTGNLAFLKKIKQYVFVLDDILLDKNGNIEKPFTGNLNTRLDKKINGREGNVLLVNGRKLPTLLVKSGVPIRWRIVNVANARFMTLEIPKHRITRIGGDGGLMLTPERNRKTLRVVPGERADIIFTPKGAPGTEVIVYWKDSPRGRHAFATKGGKIVMSFDPTDGKRKRLPLMKLQFDNSEEATTKKPVKIAIPGFLKQIAPLNTKGARIRTIVLAHSTPTKNGSVDFTINGKTFKKITSEDAPDAVVGETQVWDIVNKTMGDHPFHLHGFFFQVLGTIKKDKTGKVLEVIQAPRLEHKDTVNIPGGPDHDGGSTTVRLAIKFDQGDAKATDIIAYGGVSALNKKNNGKKRSGGWQFHCHVLEHADQGMMSYVEIRDPSTYTRKKANPHQHHHMHMNHNKGKTTNSKSSPDTKTGKDAKTKKDAKTDKDTKTTKTHKPGNQQQVQKNQKSTTTIKNASPKRTPAVRRTKRQTTRPPVDTGRTYPSNDAHSPYQEYPPRNRETYPPPIRRRNTTPANDDPEQVF